jgi:hypothetical protein
VRLSVKDDIYNYWTAETDTIALSSHCEVTIAVQAGYF